MLLFIPGELRSGNTSISVSIHHMLLFIWRKTNMNKLDYLRFNTSHVTLYRWPMTNSFSSFRRFNTSHVTLYHAGRTDEYFWLCGFNTSHVTLYRGMVFYSSIRIARFNTSHVTLYQIDVFFAVGRITFQYITCYSLSVTCNFTGWCTAFQYITCYSLSKHERKAGKDRTVSIHHMLLFISPQPWPFFFNWVRFNTSHVTLYHCRFCYELDEGVFQYITCYSLSAWSHSSSRP